MIGPAAVDAAPGMATRLTDGEPVVQHMAVWALTQAGAEAWRHAAMDDALPVLAAMLSAGDVQLRNVALGAVSEIGPRAHPLVPRLRMMVQSSGAASVDPQAAHYAVYALAAVGEAAVSALAEALGSSDVVTRLLAAEALGRIGPAAAEAAPALAAALADPRPEVHWAAFDALVAVGPAAVPALADLVQDTSQRDDARHLGLLALGEMGAAAVQAAPVLIRLLGEEAWWRPALQALGSMGAAAGPFLMEAMTDPDPFIAWTSAFLLREAGEAAVSAGGERSAGYLFSALAHDDADIRQVAVWGLGVAAAAGAASAEAALPALIGALGDEARAVRLEAQTALWQQGPAVVPLLAEAFRNPASVLGDPPGGAGRLRSGLRGPFSGRGNPHRVRAAGGGAAAGRFGRRRPLGPLAGGVGAEHAGAGHLLRFGRGGQAAGGRAAGERPARADLAGAGGRPPRCRTPRSPPSRATPEPRSTGRWLTPSGRIMRPPTPWSWPEPRSTTCFCWPSPT